MRSAIRVKKQNKLSWSMVLMLLAGWLFPLALIALLLLYFESASLSGQIENTIEVSTDKAVDICEIQLAEIVSASKNASYITTVRNSYNQYMVDGNKQMLYKEITNFLNQHYKYDQSFICTTLFFLDEPWQIYYATNSYQENSKSTGGYSTVQFFRDNTMDDIIALGQELDTDVELVYLSGRLYLIRNIVDTYYEPYAMIVIEVDPITAFHSLDSVWGAINHDILINGQPILNSGSAARFDNSQYDGIIGESTYIRKGNDAYAFKNIKFGKDKITFLVELDSKAIIDELRMIRYTFVLLFLFMIPLIVLIFYFFHTKVTKPISNLVKASDKITAGEYGYQISEKKNSEEFGFLIDAFNTMSTELQRQFRQIYLEELALRDANIMALQSQINPHFLNNTLEIINWEARMNGNEKVSDMIGALGTMLNFTMNRKQLHFHSLQEELTYVDAYLYIMSRRFENRFTVEREIDQTLLSVEVPRLIIQPVVENAVKHGMKENKRGKVKISIYTADKDMFIKIINDRKLQDSEKEKIATLLNGGEEQQEGRVSLGIRNVDQRLKIIYGDFSMLTIEGDENDNTVSTIKIRLYNRERR